MNSYNIYTHAYIQIIVRFCGICVLLMIFNVRAAPGDAIGSEYLVNTTNIDSQQNADVAMSADGNYVVTWQSVGQDGDEGGIYARHYNKDGSTASAEFLVNSTTSGNQVNPSIAMAANGDYVIAWTSDDQGDLNVYAQVYFADGTPHSNEFIVNTYTDQAQFAPDVAIDTAGEIIIVWESRDQDSSGSGVYYRLFSSRYNVVSAAFSPEKRVNETPAFDQRKPSVAMDENGRFVVTWENESGGDIYARDYWDYGSGSTGEYRVNEPAAECNIQPDVAIDVYGNHVITWRNDPSCGYYPGSEIFARSYKVNGIATGEILIHSTSLSIRDPKIAMDADGDFVITWESGNADIHARNYDSNAAPETSDYVINSTTSDNQFSPAIAMDADADYVIVWSSNDGDASGIYGQRYEGYSETVDLNIVVQDNADPVMLDDEVFYTVMITNNGTGIALGLGLMVDIPPSFANDNKTESLQSDWDCFWGPCYKAFMEPGEMNTIEISRTVFAIGGYTVTSEFTVEAAQSDANFSDNSDVEDTDVVVAVDDSTSNDDQSEDGGMPSGGGGGGGGALNIVSLLMLWFWVLAVGHVQKISSRH